MSEKRRDRYARWRNKTIAFRVSPEEYMQIKTMASLCGMKMQDYLTSNMLHREITVVGNPRVFKAVRDELRGVCSQLERLSACSEASDEFLRVLAVMEEIVSGMVREKEEK